MNILISGCGIAGNALAFWLSRQGHAVTVVERFDGLRTTGLQIDLRGHGIEVLKRMGLEQAFRAKSVAEQGWELVDSAGRRRAFFPANTSGKGTQSFTSEYEIMRGDLVELMYEANKGRVEYVFGTSIRRLEEKDGGVDVVFANGTTGRFDLLVGADGQWSRTRRMMMMLGPNKAADANDAADDDALRPLPDTYVAYFTIPRPIQPGEGYVATSYMAPGSRGVMVRRSNPDTIQVYLGGRTPSDTLRAARRGDVAAEKRAVADIFHGMGWRTDEILAAMMRGADDFYCERLCLVDAPCWSKGRVALVGDAAYCPTVNTGMGTTSSIVGAYVLAGEISRHCRSVAPGKAVNVGGNSSSNGDNNNGQRLTAALQAYEHTFRPFMTQVQKGVLEDKGFFPETWWGIALLHCVVGVAAFFRLNFTAWALKENVKNWDLPEYDGMVVEAGPE